MNVIERPLNILIVDDNPNHLKIYQKALELPIAQKNQISNSIKSCFNVVCLNQAEESVQHVKTSLDNQNPFALAFIDINLPPGKDGIWAAKEIRRLDKHIELAMVTGFDGSAAKLAQEDIPPQHKIICIHKPFHILEISCFAHSLGAKWKNERQLSTLLNQLEANISEKTLNLIEQNQRLNRETEQRKKAEEKLIKINESLEHQIKSRTKTLEETNIALKVLLEQREKDKSDFGENILKNIKHMVLPFYEKLKRTQLNQHQKQLLSTIEANLNDILSPLLVNLNEQYHDLTPTELKVARFVVDGKTNKEIADLIGVSTGTILTHRHKLRAKLGLKNKKINLRSHLATLM